MRNLVMCLVCAVFVCVSASTQEAKPESVRLSFAEAISRTFEKSFDVQRAHISLLSAKTDQLKTFAQMGPYGNFTLNDTTNSNVVSSQGIVIQPAHVQQANATLGINLTAIVAGLIKIWSTGSTVGLTRAQEESIKVETVFSVAQLYRLAQRARMNVDVAKSRIEATKRQQKDAEAYYAYGVISKGDRLQIDLLNNTAAIELANAENDLIKADNALKKVVGVPAESELILDEMIHISPEMVPELPAPAEALNQALTERSDLAAAHQAVSSQSSSRWLTLAPYLPLVSTEMNWQWNFGIVSDFVLPHTQNFTINLKWNFWDNGASFLDFRNVTLELRRARINLKERTIDVRNDVEQSLRDLQLAKKTLALRDIALAQAEEVFKGFETRFSLGAANVTEFLFSENALHRAKLDHLAATVGIDIAFMNMQKAIGQKMPVPLGEQR